MRITDIRYERLHGTYDTSAGHSVARQVGALDIYPEYRNRKTPSGAVYEDVGQRPISEVYVFVDTDEGITGLFGPIYVDQAFQIDTHFRQHLIGQLIEFFKIDLSGISKHIFRFTCHLVEAHIAARFQQGGCHGHWTDTYFKDVFQVKGVCASRK